MGKREGVGKREEGVRRKREKERESGKERMIRSTSQDCEPCFLINDFVGLFFSYRSTHSINSYHLVFLVGQVPLNSYKRIGVLVFPFDKFLFGSLNVH